jgi:hypothetical protein
MDNISPDAFHIVHQLRRPTFGRSDVSVDDYQVVYSAVIPCGSKAGIVRPVKQRTDGSGRLRSNDLDSCAIVSCVKNSVSTG